MENNYIKEYLMTGAGTEGQLLIPRKIYDIMIKEVDKKLIPRTEAAIVLGPSNIPGSSVDIDLETPNTFSFRLVGEGAEVPLDSQDYTSINLKPRKYGVAIRLTREMIEDSQFPLFQMHVQKAAIKAAENENSLIVSDALANGTNTVTGGAAITIANITRGMQYLEDADYTPTTLFVGMEVLNDLRNIDTFVDYSKLGSTEMIDTGYVGTVYGLKVIPVSSNAGFTTTRAYVTDKKNAYVIAEKRPFSVENFTLPTYDMSGAVVTHRIKARQLRADAICIITTT